MQTLTFTQKLLRQRRFLSFLLPLFAIFVGLGLPQKVLAQPNGTSVASIRNVFVTYGTTSSATTGTYNAIPTTGGSNPSGTIFANTDFGSYDVNTGRLQLQGGTVEITETNGETFDRAFIGYAVGPGSLTGTVNPSFNGVQQIELVQTGYNASTGVRTFSLNNAARDILALATAGATNRFDITVNATGVDGNGDAISTAGTGSRRRSQFTATGTPSTATLNPNTIQVAADGGAASTYYFPNTGTNPQFPGATFCSSQNAGGTTCAFDINNGQLRLINTTVTTNETGSSTVSTVVLYYRTRLANSAGGAFQPITLTQSGSVSNGQRTFIIDPASINNTNAQPNLIATPAVTASGNYVVDIYYQANGTNNATGVPFSIVYPPSGVLSANFTVAGTPIATTIWTGAINDNWFDPGNWSNGVPNANANALIRDLGAGNAVPYPNINSDTRVTTASGTLLYDNTGSGPARARNLIMGGNSQASRSITRLVTGQLQVYGDFDNSYDSFIQRENTIMEFAGANQNITGGSFIRVDISGGGTKTLQGIMNVTESLNFLTPNVNDYNTVRANPYTTLNANAGVLLTNIQTPTLSVVILADRALINNNNGAQINGETDDSYLRGFARTSRLNVLAGETRTYGNLGLTITFTGANSPGAVDVTRNTAEAYAPVMATTGTSSGRYGIRRIFGVRPSDPQTNTGGLIATLIFRYRDSETQNLNGPNTYTPGTSSIPESNLVMFVSSNSGNTFTPLFRDAINTTTNEVTKSGVTIFATFTLGDRLNPLPVTLKNLVAKRVGNDAQIDWETATEQNNKGFEVQVSTNGSDFRTIGFVEAASANSTVAKSYSFLDVEKNKTGDRYYRLRQLDLDGKENFFGPRVVNFSGKDAEAVAVLAYPNPFSSADQLHLTLQSAATGKGSVTVTDMTGRTVRQQALELGAGSNDVTLERLNDLKAGVYMVRISQPNGLAQSLKVVKQ